MSTNNNPSSEPPGSPATSSSGQVPSGPMQMHTPRGNSDQPESGQMNTSSGQRPSGGVESTSSVSTHLPNYTINPNNRIHTNSTSTLNSTSIAGTSTPLGDPRNLSRLRALHQRAVALSGSSTSSRESAGNTSSVFGLAQEQHRQEHVAVPQTIVNVTSSYSSSSEEVKQPAGLHSRVNANDSITESAVADHNQDHNQAEESLSLQLQQRSDRESDPIDRHVHQMQGLNNTSTAPVDPLSSENKEAYRFNDREPTAAVAMENTNIQDILRALASRGYNVSINPLSEENVRGQSHERDFGQATPVIRASSMISHPSAMMDSGGVRDRAGDGFLKLKSLLPVWREGSKRTCVEFLRELTELLSTTNYPETQWYRVFPLVVEEGFNRTWVHKNIVSKYASSVSWKEACTIFKAHFESSDYIEKVWAKWHSIRFEHGESVQHFSDRFRVMLEELELSPSDTVVQKHFLRTLPSNIRSHYDNFCLNRELDDGEPYEPSTVDKVIAICVRIENNLKNRSNHSFVPSSSGYRTSVHAPTNTSSRSSSSGPNISGNSSSSKKCPVHPQGSHTWAECRQNAANSKASSQGATAKPSGQRSTSQSTNSAGQGNTYARSSSSTEGVPRKDYTGHDLSKVKCFKCEKTGHYANKCPSASTNINNGNKTNKSMNVKVIQVVEASASQDQLQEAKGADHDRVQGTAASMASDGVHIDHDQDKATLVLAPVISGSTLSGVDLLGKGKIYMVLQGNRYPVLADSGADLSVMDKALANELNLARVPSKGKLDLAVVNIQASREYRTTNLRYQIVFDSKLEEYKMPPQSFEGAFEILKFPLSSEYPIIIGKDLLPNLFLKAIPLCFMSPPPSFVEPHRLIRKESSPSIGLASAGGLSSETDSDVEESEEHQPKEMELNWQAPIIAASTANSSRVGEQDLADIDDLPDEQDKERAPAVFTMPNLEDEYAAHRDQLMSDPELVQALEENANITGFCSHPDSELKLVIKPFMDGVVPKKLCRPQYRIAERVRHLVRECIERWHTEGKIMKAPPGIPYNNPIVVAPKKDSAGNVTWEEVRVCLDFRGLNECLDGHHMDQFQLPFIRDTIDKFNGCKIFGEFDLAEAFYQLKLHEESRPYTAFTFEGQQYMCAGVPFGLSIVPSHFQRVISTIMHGLDFTFPYMDNLPFGSKDWETHRQQALTVIRLMTKHNLKIKPSSVKLGHSHMRCLGHFVSIKGIGIDPKKLSMVPDWPRPTTGKELMSFLGFVTFIRDHIRHVADLTGPLEAVKNNKVLEWNDTLEEAFRLTKEAIRKAPFLQYPDYTRPFHIATDASNTGVGGVLFQPKEHDEYITADNIVAICSKKLQPCQTRWSAYKKEYYAILYALRQFRPYVWGRNDLVIYTDHKPLTFVMTSPSLSNTVHGWFDEMGEYNFKVIHRPGILNVVPDALSRMYAASYSDTWGVSDGFNMSNITLVDEPAATSPKDVTGPIHDQKPAGTEMESVSLAPVSVPMGEGAAESTADNEQDNRVAAEEPEDLAINVGNSNQVKVEKDSTRMDFDLLVELDRRGMTMPKTEAERRTLVEAEHAVGHFGIEAIYKGLQAKNVWWPGMRKTITSIVQDCHACNVFTVTKKGYNPSGFIHASGPWEHIQVDTSVHMPPSPDNHTTLLVVIDVFTGFVLLRACKSSTAEEVAAELWSIFCTFGFPKILQSDNGHEFVNDTLRALVKISGLEHRFISPYNPRADGKVERAIGTLVQVIKKMVHGTNMLWPMYTQFAQYAYNRKISSLTGSTPFALMFGRAPNEWKDYTKDPPETITLDTEEQVSKWKEHQEKMVSLLLPAISQRILKQKNEMVIKLNKMRKALIPKTLKEGTEVYILDPKKENKWQPKYLGPYVVARRALNGGYVLKDSTGDLLDRHVPIDQIKVLSSKDMKARSEANVNVPNAEEQLHMDMHLEDVDSDHEDAIASGQVSDQGNQEDAKQEATLTPVPPPIPTVKDSGNNSSSSRPQPKAYVVEAILKHKGDNPSNYQFLVKWEGYPHSQNTWEPITSFEDREVITKYFKKLRKEKISNQEDSGANDRQTKKPRRK